MDNHPIPQKKGPQYNASSARGTEADQEYQYGKSDHNAQSEDPKDPDLQKTSKS